MSTIVGPSLIELQTRQRLAERAMVLLAQRGLYGGLLEDAAGTANVGTEQARIFFRRDEDLVIALHERLAGDFENSIADLPPGTLAERFEGAMRLRFEHLAPYRLALTKLMPVLLQPESEHGVFSRHTETVRIRVRAVFAAAVLGASDAPSPSLADALARVLYALHLGLLLLWIQDQSENFIATKAVLALGRDLLNLAGPLSAFPAATHLLANTGAVLQPWLDRPADGRTVEQTERILRTLFRHRRLLPGAGACANEPCNQCIALHSGRVQRFASAGLPIHLVLPAFPAKSPSLRKVLGRSPDRAEELAIEHLATMCDEIRAIYPPGARVTICSDGRVFGDLVGVADDDITDYGRELRRMIQGIGSQDIDTFCSEDLFDLPSFDAIRHHLVEHYAEPIERVRSRSDEHPHHRALWSGIQRFLFEDRSAIDPGKSRTQLRKACGSTAHEVIRRSNAWTRVIAECFPTALRLSIHPQPAHSSKIGIHLMNVDDDWLTPWHGVAVEQAGEWRLMHRHQAEGLGARIVTKDGTPSHYVLDEEKRSA